MEKRNFNRDNAELLITCTDENEFRKICRLNGLTAYEFRQDDEWEGVYAAFYGGEIVYYYGDDKMRLYSNNQ